MQELKCYLTIAILQLCCWGGVSSAVFGQETKNSYYFDGNDVVFVFDIRSYGDALKNKDGGKVDFEDLDIFKVAVSGDFNNWSDKGWKMEKKGEFLFELRKPILAFNDAYPKNFRYIVNGEYIVDAEGFSTTPGKYSDEFLKDVYKLDLSVLKIDPAGNIVFHLKGHQDAREVILAGSFNGWDEHTVKMNRVANGWELRGKLPPGKYEYKFIADGEWLADPQNDVKVPNEHGTFNSVLVVTTPVRFRLEGHAKANTVILSGSFNHWNDSRIKMVRVDDAWVVTIDLPGGKHHYKFIVDGTWITDPANPLIEDDGQGNLNSVLFVH